MGNVGLGVRVKTNLCSHPSRRDFLLCNDCDLVLEEYGSVGTALRDHVTCGSRGRLLLRWSNQAERKNS